MDLFELIGKIVIKNGDANEEIDKTTDKGQKAQSKLSKAFSGIGKGAVAVGKAIGTGLAVGGTAMAGLTVKAVNLAGELEQNMGGSEQVFKQFADNVQTTAKNAFSNMGLSTSDYLATANKMGALFQGAGFSIKESMDLSSGAMQRAADVASIMGIDTSSAMEAIAGAAKGNFTMMDNLGVAMNDTTLNAYALEKGIGKTTQEMTNQEKIGLAMEMFMEKTAYAAGNYARENETLAGSLGTAKAALTNFLDGSGNVDQLVGAVMNAVEVIIKNVSEIAPRLVSGLSNVINQLMPLLPQMINQLLPVIVDGAVNLINGLVDAMPGIISALMGSLPALIEGVTQIVNALVTALPQIIEVLVAALPTLIPKLIDGLVSMIVMLCTMMPQIIQPIIDYLPEIIVAIVDALMQNLPALLDAGGQLLMGLLEGMLALMGKIPEILKGIWDAIVNGIKSLFGIHSPSTVMMEIGKNIMEGLINGIKNLFNAVSELWNTIKTTAVNIWNTIKSAITNVVNGIKTVITNVWNAIKDTISTVLSGIKNTVSNIWNAIKSAISNVINTIKTTISNVFNSVKSTISNIFDSIKSTATNVWNSIKTAMTQPIEKARDTIKGIVDKITGFFNNMQIKIPHIKLPHIRISGSLSLSPPSVPKLSIDWYAKGGIMTKPTLFDYNPFTGRAKVGGEAGAEAIAPISTLQQYVKAAVHNEDSQVVEKLDRIIEMLLQFFPSILDSLLNQIMVLDDGTLVAKIAPKMDTELGKLALKKVRGV